MAIDILIEEFRVSGTCAFRASVGLECLWPHGLGVPKSQKLDQQGRGRETGGITDESEKDRV